MKVPIRYKSSDRYNAGVDVVYDDESKMQYAPFVYATTASGDNDADGGDEEGEDTMVVNYDGTKLDKSFKEITSALSSGKFVYVCNTEADESDNVDCYIFYIARAEKSGNCTVTCKNLLDPSVTLEFSSETEDGVLNILV